MSNNNKILLPVALAIFMAAGFLLGSKLSYTETNNFISNTNKNKLNKLIDFLENEYVDSLNTDSIVDLTVNGILEKLDPHSVYISKNQWQQVSEELQGNFVGIGINFYMLNDTLAVVKPLPNGPSYKAGIKSGDRILYANNKKLFGKNLPTDSLYAILKGKPNTTVNLKVFRKSANKFLNINLKRDIIPVKSVDFYGMLNQKVGYIKMNRFAENTYDEFIIALKDLKDKKATSLILDLRDNGGGYLEIAAQIADEFLKENEIIVKTKNKKNLTEVTKATTKGIFEKEKIIILINENSASASEIIAGAIQDNDRGIVVGRRSFGKGLVQREMPLGDGSAVRLTIARYYTPSGRSIQKPFADKKDEYFNEFEKRFLSGELYQADSIKVSDSLKFKTKNGRIVYGGGGITPDVYVPLEKNHAAEATQMVMQSGIVSNFVFKELDKNRIKFSKLNQINLKSEIFNNKAYINNFINYIHKNGLYIQLDANKEKVLNYLYAEFVRQLFTDAAYYKIILEEDNMVKKALSL